MHNSANVIKNQSKILDLSFEATTDIDRLLDRHTEVKQRERDNRTYTDSQTDAETERQLDIKEENLIHRTHS